MSHHTCHSSMAKYVLVASRVLLAAIFLLSGWGKITGFEGTVGYVATALPAPEVMLVLAIIIEIIGGLSVLLGFMAPFGAAALVVYTMVASFAFHPFWSVGPEAMQMQMIMFMKNLAIIGGLLLLHVHGSGPLSVDAGKGCSMKCCKNGTCSADHEGHQDQRTESE